MTAFYPSIYTHAIPWAIHGKDVAKNDHSQRHLGNRLDKWSRLASNGQTVGLPIGPDSSFILAETLLSAVDGELAGDLSKTFGSGVSGFRYFDDYEISCRTLQEAEEALATLQDALARYELGLSPHKTRIIELPAELDTRWARELSETVFTTGQPDLLRLQITRFFTRAFSLTREHPGQPVLKYAVRRIADVIVPPQLHSLLHSLLLQCAVVDSGTLRSVLAIFDRQQHKASLKKAQLAQSLAFIIQRHAPLGHGSEVAWAIYAADVFGVTLPSGIEGLVSTMSDNIVALTALRCPAAFAATLDTKFWASLVGQGSLKGPNWLLAYEWGFLGLEYPDGDPVEETYLFPQMRDEWVSFLSAEGEPGIPAELLEGRYPASSAGWGGTGGGWSTPQSAR